MVDMAASPGVGDMHRHCPASAPAVTPKLDGVVRAYKVLSGGRSMFTGSAWPLPDGDAPGQWVQADGPVGLCTNGIHASSVDQLPQWLGDELWEVQLDGE